MTKKSTYRYMKSFYAKAAAANQTKLMTEDMEAAHQIPDPLTPTDVARIEKAEIKRQKRAQKRST